MNYSAPCSLSRFLKTWKTEETKGIFPHGYYSNIEELNTVEFPPKSAFFDSIRRRDMEDDLYISAKNEYERRLSLPEDHEDKFFNMKSYLEYYNMLGKFMVLFFMYSFSFRLPTFGSSYQYSIWKLFPLFSNRSSFSFHSPVYRLSVRTSIDSDLNSYNFKGHATAL